MHTTFEWRVSTDIYTIKGVSKRDGVMLANILIRAERLSHTFPVRLKGGRWGVF